MSCCNLKVLSYTSATLQLLIFFSIFISVILFLIFKDLLPADDEYMVVTLLIIFVTFLYITILSILLVGLKQNRIVLVTIYLYADHLLLGVAIIYLIYELIRGFANKENSCEILLNLLIEFGIIAMKLILTIPIYKILKKMHRKTTSKEESSPKASCSDWSNNMEENLNKDIKVDMSI